MFSFVLASNFLVQVFDPMGCPSSALILSYPRVLFMELQSYMDLITCVKLGAEVLRHCQKQTEANIGCVTVC